MPMFTLKGKTALVTGSGSGIGAAIAVAFAEAGARVCVADREKEGGLKTVELARAQGGQAEFRLLDVTDEAAITALVPDYSMLDILVNTAGIGHVGNLLKTSASDLDRLFAVNVRGSFNLCKAFLPGMIERGLGSVINLASIGGVVAVRDRLAYTTTKFAVVGLTKALALDHSHSGVRINCICPGRVETPFVQARLQEYPDPEQAYLEMSSTQLNGRMVRVVEVAAAAVYLAADESAMVTGTTFMIDGGWSAGK